MRYLEVEILYASVQRGCHCPVLLFHSLFQPIAMCMSPKVLVYRNLNVLSIVFVQCAHMRCFSLQEIPPVVFQILKRA